jgi:DNA-binding transcriptional LysR family regulator
MAMGLLDDHFQNLRLAALNNVWVNDLLEPLRQFREKFPKVSLRLTESPSNPARRLMEEDEIDLAIVGLMERELPSSLAMDLWGRTSCHSSTARSTRTETSKGLPRNRVDLVR